MFFMSMGNGQVSMGNGQVQPSNFNRKFGQAIRFLYQGRVQNAILLLEALHQHDPDHLELLKNLGAAYIIRQRYDEARVLLERAVELDPNDSDLWVNLAAARLGELEKSTAEPQNLAIDAYKRALNVNPEAANVHYMLGLVYRQRKEYLPAIAHFSMALDQDPNDSDARNMLADLGFS